MKGEGGCKPLSEYSWFIEQIRKNRETMEIESAVDKAISEMPEDFEIRMFLIGHKSEVKSMYEGRLRLSYNLSVYYSM